MEDLREELLRQTVNRLIDGDRGEIEKDLLFENRKLLVDRLAQTLNERREKETREDGAALTPMQPDEVINGLAQAIQNLSVREVYDRGKDIEFSYIDFLEPDKPTLIYDAVKDVFLAEPILETVTRKEREYEIERARFEDIARRLNQELGGFNIETDLARVVAASSMLTGVLEETDGAKVMESHQGRYFYIERNENREHSIFYDAESNLFMATSMNELREKRLRQEEAALNPIVPAQNTVVERDEEETEITAETPDTQKPEKLYSLGYGSLGNGTTVWNRLEEKDGDYVTVAHIGADGAVNFFDDEMPEKYREEIISVAAREKQRSEEQPQPPAKSILDELDWPKPRNKTDEHRQEFAKKIIALMEQGEAFWQQPWNAPGRSLPVNAVSGRHYNGVNIAYLMSAALDKGYTDPRWMTYKQAEEKGYNVRRGEHGTKVEYYGEYDLSKTKNGEDILNRKMQELTRRGASQEEIEKAMEDQKMIYVKNYTVFNASQIEGIEPLPDMTETSAFRYHERAENIMANCGVTFQYGSPDAAYSISKDRIRMPNREWFSTPEHFYSTALHEIAHSTGHSSRMNRDSLGAHFGSPVYAMEELRAEMASAFVFQEIGMQLSPEDMEEHSQAHAAYTQHWLKKFQSDYKEFFKAVRDAAKIADYTLAYEQNKNIAAETGAASLDPVEAAKALIGQNAIVTSAQKGRTYTGEILQVDQGHAIQKIGNDRGIIHSLAKIGGRELLDFPDGSRPTPGKTVSITYDNGNRGSVKSASCEFAEERDSAVSR